MENENIIIKGTPKKNKVALIVLLSGIAVAIISFIVASYYFNNVDGYEYFGFGYGGWYTYCVIYDFNFFDFYFSEFFGSCIHGYMLIAGVIAIIVGLIMKFNTEKCEITVTNNRIFGKLAHGKEVNIPLNQVTGLHSCSFDGVSVASIGNVSDFHCIANHEEVMKAISYLLANPQGAGTSPVQVSNASTSSSSNNEAEQLKRFKDLLDSGVITQEEFDAKKKEILGL
jgi:hypothetical protein